MPELDAGVRRPARVRPVRAGRSGPGPGPVQADARGVAGHAGEAPSRGRRRRRPTTLAVDPRSARPAVALESTLGTADRRVDPRARPARQRRPRHRVRRGGGARRQRDAALRRLDPRPPPGRGDGVPGHVPGRQRHRRQHRDRLDRARRDLGRQRRSARRTRCRRSEAPIPSRRTPSAATPRRRSSSSSGPSPPTTTRARPSSTGRSSGRPRPSAGRAPGTPSS